MENAEEKVSILLQNKMWAYLEPVCNEALTTEHDSSFLFYVKGLLKLKEEKLEDAKALFLISLEKNPNAVLPLCGLHLYYYLSDDYKNAKKYIEEAISKSPENISIHTSRAWFYIKENKNDMAKIALKEATSIDPNYEELLNAKLYYTRHHNTEDESYFLCQEILKQYPENHVAHFLLSEIYLKQNKLDKAEEHCKISLRLNPTEATERFLFVIKNRKENTFNFSILFWALKRKLKKIFIPGYKNKQSKKINWDK